MTIGFRLIRALCKPGAPIILSTPNERSIETSEFDLDSNRILFYYIQLYNPMAITALLRRNGFRVVELLHRCTWTQSA